jgi:hypothetical protein
MLVSMNPAVSAAKANINNAAVSRNEDHQDHMAKFSSQMAQIAKANQMRANADTVQFGHGKETSLASAATTGAAAVGSAAAAAGSVWAFTPAAAAAAPAAGKVALAGAEAILGSIGAPIVGIGLAATSALLGLFAISNFFGGNKK